MQFLVELMLNGALAGIKIGVSALGFAIIFYATKEMHFAFGAISVAAAYVCYWITTGLGSGLLAFTVGVLGAMVFAMAFSVFIHRKVYLRLRAIMPVVMSSLGISLLLENVIQIIGSPDTQIIIYENLTRLVHFGPYALRALEVWLIVFYIALTAGLWLFLNRSRYGQAFVATIEDPEMAELVGIRVSRMKVGAYCIGAALGAISGIAMLLDVGVKPGHGFIFLIYALMITIMGRGSFMSVATWAVLFGVLRSLWSWQMPTEFQELAMFALMMTYLISRDAYDRYNRNKIRPLGALASKGRANALKGA